jgi:hypothetical protein
MSGSGLHLLSHADPVWHDGPNGFQTSRIPPCGTQDDENGASLVYARARTHGPAAAALEKEMRPLLFFLPFDTCRRSTARCR